MKHPMQPIVWVDGVIRFKENAIVRYLLDHGGIDLNRIAILASDPANGFTRDDAEQFAQLIGYSVSGFGDLSYVSKKTVEAADEIAAKLLTAKRARKSK